VNDFPRKSSGWQLLENKSLVFGCFQDKYFSGD